MGTVRIVTMAKDGRTTTLHGMRHVAPFAFYENVQWAMDVAADRGDQIFREGIKLDDLPPPRSRDEKAIRALMLHWIESYAVEAKKEDWQLQRECLTYPDSTVLADIDLDEITQLLDINRFRCKLLTYLLDRKSPPARAELIDLVVSAVHVAQGLKVEFSNWREEALVELFSCMGEKLYTIIILHRNMVAMDVVRRHDDGLRNIFLSYGDAHISGLTNYFVLDGWAIEKVQEVDPEKVRKPVVITVPEEETV